MVEKYFALKYYGGIAFFVLMAISAAAWLIIIWRNNRR